MQAPNFALTTALDLLQQLDALRPLTADQEQRIWQKFRLDWNYHSNNLEGNSLTYGETKSLLLHNITAQGKPLKDHLEITGHNEALLEISDAVKKRQPLTEAFLRQLHTLILKERYQVSAQTADGQATKKWVEVGQYKTQPNHVLTVTGETFRFAEPFEVPAKMQALIAEANERKATPLEGLLLAAKLHYEFVLIHPFDDGNGRMARILMNLVLMQYGFPPAIIKTEAKEAYFAALRQADGGQFEAFSDYIASRASESLNLMIAGVSGLSIEEPDDIDKQIRVFIASAKAKIGHLPLPLSDEVFADFYAAAIVKLAQQFDLKMKEFQKLYKNYSISFSTQISPGSFDNYDLRQLEADANVRQIFFNKKSMQIMQRFNGLSLVDGTHNFQLGINFSFGDFKASAYLNNSSHIADISYNAPSFDEFVVKLVRVSSEEHLAWLKSVSGIDPLD